MSIRALLLRAFRIVWRNEEDEEDERDEPRAGTLSLSDLLAARNALEKLDAARADRNRVPLSGRRRMRR